MHNNYCLQQRPYGTKFFLKKYFLKTLENDWLEYVLSKLVFLGVEDSGVMKSVTKYFEFIKLWKIYPFFLFP